MTSRYLDFAQSLLIYTALTSTVAVGLALLDSKLRGPKRSLSSSPLRSVIHLKSAAFANWLALVLIVLMCVYFFTGGFGCEDERCYKIDWLFTIIGGSTLSGLLLRIGLKCPACGAPIYIAGKNEPRNPMDKPKSFKDSALGSTLLGRPYHCPRCGSSI